jgi:cbb3-type cytochrome oxidase subunit 3
VDWVHNNFVIILLALFGGVLFWAFRPRKKTKNQSVIEPSSYNDEV